MPEDLTPEEAEVQEMAERHGLVLKRSSGGRYDFHDNEIDQDVTSLGGPDRWRWKLPGARRYLERDGWIEDRDLYREASDIAQRRGWQLVNYPSRRMWVVRDAAGVHRAQGPFRTCVRWLREQSLDD